MRRILLLIPLLLVGSCGKPGSDGNGTASALAAPTGVTTYGTATESSLGFKWNAVDGAEQYRYRLLIGEREVDNNTTTNRFVKFDKLVKGTTYRFFVAALKGSEQSPWSAALEAKTEGEAEGGDVTPLEGELYPHFAIPAAEDADGAARAFPGAEGGGMFTTGGRGGKVLHVTRLDDDNNEGSLRWAIGQSGARTVVFDVAGIITLTSDLKITKGDITIAGQTAPGDGICIKNYCTWIDADNVIIRFLRFRLGDEAPWSASDITAGKADGQDCINSRYHSNIILDHCSMSWSVDECASFYANENFTLQWCLMAESMQSCGLHKKTSGGGNHGYCGLWGGKNASFHHNILAHHYSRNARIDHPHIYENHNAPARRGNVELRNNVVYNWGDNSAYGGEGGSFNLVNNYYKPGPSSKDRAYFVDAYAVYTSNCSTCGSSNIEHGYPKLYFSGNVHTKYPSLENGSGGVYWHQGSGHENYQQMLSSALPISGKDGKDAYSTLHSAETAVTRTCAWAGASLARDAVDERICNDVKNGSGTLINDIAGVKAVAGGVAWPEYKGETLTDTDADGIPDHYERLFSLNLNDPADAAAKTIDPKGRYSNLEMYLHYLVKDIVTAGNEGGNYMKL